MADETMDVLLFVGNHAQMQSFEECDSCTSPFLCQRGLSVYIRKLYKNGVGGTEQRSGIHPATGIS